MNDLGGFRTTYMITAEDSLGAVTERVLAAVAMGVDLVQVRQKQRDTRQVEDWLTELVCARPNLKRRLILNTRWDLAIALGIRGVHLPEAGLPIAAVRADSPRGFLIGASRHTVDGVVAAGDAGADFIVFGPIFRTPSKPKARALGLEALRAASQCTKVPVLALGGIHPGKLGEVADTGAAGIAGISMFRSEASSRLVMQKMQSLGVDTMRG